MIIDNHQCAKELQNLLYNQWGSTRQWQKLLSMSTDEISFRSPTNTPGKWVQVYANEFNIRTTLIGKNNTLVIDWANNCQKSIANVKTAKKVKRHINSLSDSDIQRLVATKKDGIIYIWAPEMPYSIEGIKEIEESAKKMKVNLTVLLSPVSDEQFARKVIKQKKLDTKFLKRHESRELHLRGVDLHYPSIITYKKAKLNRYARHGYEPEKFFTSYLKQEFKKR